MKDYSGKKTNPIFKLIEVSNKSTFDLKEDKNKQKYFFKALPSDEQKIELLNQLWDITDQHLSIYGKFNDKRKYITAYHFTMALAFDDEKPIKVHCYFNVQGIYQALTVKKEEKYQIISPTTEAKLKNHAELYSVNVFTELQGSLESRCFSLMKLIDKKEKSIEKLSQNIEKNLMIYIEQITQLIPLLEEVHDLGLGQRPKIKIYQRILELYTTQKAPKKVMIKEYEPINEELSDSELESSTILPKREEAEDLSEKNIDILIEALKKMNPPEKIDPQKLVETAIQGDEKAMRIIFEKNYPLKFNAYIRMIEQGNKNFFEKAYERSPINLNILTVNDRNQNTGLSFLGIAYLKRNLYLFEYLLQKGANPNVAFLNGERLIHHIAETGELKYAECLLKYYPETDISSYSSLDKITSVYCESSRNPQEAKKIKSNLEKNLTRHQDVCNNTPFTPLMIAAHFGQVDIFKFLLESKANPLLELKNTNSLMALASSHQNPEIILALINQGMSVDHLWRTSGPPITSLYHACQEGNLRVVEILIANFGADVNFSTSYPGASPILGKDLKLNPLSTAIENRAKSKEGIKFQLIIDYLMNQDFVPFKMSAFKQVLAYEKLLSVSPEIKENIQLNMNKFTLLAKANRAFNSNEYKIAADTAREGLVLRKGKYQPSQYREQLLNVLYLSYYGLHDYLKSGVFCSYYLKFLKIRLEKILNPKLFYEVKATYQVAEKRYQEQMKTKISNCHHLLLSQILESKEKDTEFQSHLNLKF